MRQQLVLLKQGQAVLPRLCCVAFMSPCTDDTKAELSQLAQRKCRVKASTGTKKADLTLVIQQPSGRMAELDLCCYHFPKHLLLTLKHTWSPAHAAGALRHMQKHRDPVST